LNFEFSFTIFSGYIRKPEFLNTAPESHTHTRLLIIQLHNSQCKLGFLLQPYSFAVVHFDTNTESSPSRGY